MAAGLTIEVEGLVAMQRELRAVDRDFPKELRVANKAAAEMVAAGTRSSFAGRPGVAPKVAASVKALAQQREASVQIGGARYPYALGSEFGSLRYTQFPAWRGSGRDAGYSLYPTIRDKTDDIVESYGEAVDRLLRKAFPG